jgi:hypothetical protein
MPVHTLELFPVACPEQHTYCYEDLQHWCHQHIYDGQDYIHCPGYNSCGYSLSDAKIASLVNTEDLQYFMRLRSIRSLRVSRGCWLCGHRRDAMAEPAGNLLLQVACAECQMYFCASNGHFDQSIAGIEYSLRSAHANCASVMEAKCAPFERHVQTEQKILSYAFQTEQTRRAEYKSSLADRRRNNLTVMLREREEAEDNAARREEKRAVLHGIVAAIQGPFIVETFSWLVLIDLISRGIMIYVGWYVYGGDVALLNQYNAAAVTNWCVAVLVVDMLLSYHDSAVISRLVCWLLYAQTMPSARLVSTDLSPYGPLAVCGMLVVRVGFLAWGQAMLLLPYSDIPATSPLTSCRIYYWCIMRGVMLVLDSVVLVAFASRLLFDSVSECVSVLGGMPGHETASPENTIKFRIGLSDIRNNTMESFYVQLDDIDAIASAPKIHAPYRRHVLTDILPRSSRCTAEGCQQSVSLMLYDCDTDKIDGLALEGYYALECSPTLPSFQSTQPYQREQSVQSAIRGGGITGAAERTLEHRASLDVCIHSACPVCGRVASEHEYEWMTRSHYWSHPKAERYAVLSWQQARVSREIRAYIERIRSTASLNEHDISSLIVQVQQDLKALGLGSELDISLPALEDEVSTAHPSWRQRPHGATQRHPNPSDDPPSNSFEVQGDAVHAWCIWVCFLYLICWCPIGWATFQMAIGSFRMNACRPDPGSEVIPEPVGTYYGLSFNRTMPINADWYWDGDWQVLAGASLSYKAAVRIVGGELLCRCMSAP